MQPNSNIPQWIIDRDYFRCNCCNELVLKKHMGRLQWICDSCEAKCDEPIGENE